MRITRSIAALTIPFALLAAGCSDDSADSTTTEPPASTEAPATNQAPASTGTIAAVASADPNLSMLVDLVSKAGLADELSSEGPFTVFAPNNEAFAKVDKATLESLAADPTGALADVLKLHVVSGKIVAADAVAADGTSIETLNGGKLKVEVVNGEVVVGGAKVVTPDVEASNGVIHVIDSVITTPNG